MSGFSNLQRVKVVEFWSKKSITVFQRALNIGVEILDTDPIEKTI